ncbi:uncharacterized protein LOC111016817 [Momordica charantia]|uniref:Uncharacterized protein LOC111016817 n=1 Tax=Momordica charantia TaxID=3673 RepID=A0A6J1D2T0_MOMCH|nr:uncharacterized protein LOC111016817 [Momordica charantia]
MASEMIDGATDNLVELIVRDEPPSMADGGPILEEIAPLLTQAEKPKINIFTISYPRRKPMEQVNKIHDNEVSPLSQSIIWIWGGSRYSGLLCASLSSIFYFTMEVLTDVFSAQSMPILEMAFTRCTIITILSYLWLRRSEQPIFGQTHVRKLLVSRALTGLLSMLSFIYSIQRLPLSQTVVLSFTTPILASIMSRIILHEKLKISDFGGLACSFFGVLLIFQEIFTIQGLTKAGKESTKPALGSHYLYAALFGFVASIAGGITYCLIRAGAKASDQPVVTVFFFGMLACPVTGICTVIYEDLVLPSLNSFLVMLVLGLVAFLAEVCWARGLQLEKTNKVANVRFLEAALVQLWLIGVLRVAPVGRLVGIVLILISMCWTFYVGPDKEIE